MVAFVQNAPSPRGLFSVTFPWKKIPGLPAGPPATASTKVSPPVFALPEPVRVEDSDDVTARWDTRVKTNLTDTMFAQLQWVLTYDNTPVTGLDRQDHLLALTIGWTF